jgi:ABC-type protease/lipase transport system fused ATPase/permease subunit
MKQSELLESEDLDRLQIFIYLIPVLGFFPALWSLYRQTGRRSLADNSERSRQNASRLAVTLAMSWIIGYAMLGAGAQAEESLTLPLLVTSSLLTSGYFLVNIWLMVRLWKGQAIRLPGISRLSDRIP